MARLLPEVSIESIDRKPERDVAEALVNGLPADCTVIHSYPWLRENFRGNRSQIQEGEIDFLVLHPGIGGFLVIEVKGGDVFYDSNTGRWMRKPGNKVVKNPFEQASKGMHYLKDVVYDRAFAGREKYPFVFGYAVVFPDCDFKGSMPPGADNTVLFGCKDMPKLGERISSALRRWAGDRQSLPRDQFAKLRQAVLPEFNLIQVLSRRIEEDEEALIRLTDIQSYVMQAIGGWQQALIEGVAGSGKTLLALEQARRFASRGQRVLFTCYNKMLAAWLDANLVGELREKIMIRHFHGLARDLCVAAGIEFVIPEDPEERGRFWKTDVPMMVLDAASKQNLSYDAIVVDEGQDFYPEWWDALHCLNAGGNQGNFYVFYDPAQNLYAGQSFVPPFTGNPFRLPHNCRNTRRIAGHCAEIISCEIQTPPFAPEGEPCVISMAADENEAAVQLQRILDGWLHNGLKLSQIAVLCPHKRSDTILKGKQKIGNCKISNDLSRWRSGETALFETVRSFKGLEADAIVLFALPPTNEGSHFTRADYYVAASRAKHLLQVIELKK